MVFLLSVFLRKLFFKEQNYTLDKIYTMCNLFFVWICPQNILILAWETYSEKFTCFAYRKRDPCIKTILSTLLLLLSYIQKSLMGALCMSGSNQQIVFLWSLILFWGYSSLMMISKYQCKCSLGQILKKLLVHDFFFTSILFSKLN